MLRDHLIDIIWLGTPGLLHGQDDSSPIISLQLTISAHLRKIKNHITVIYVWKIKDNNQDPKVCLRILKFEDPECNFGILALTPINSIMQNTEMPGRMAKWSMKVGTYDIKYEPRSTIK